MSNNNKSSAITPVIICGGFSMRLLHLSWVGDSKQFLVFFGDDSNQSLFQQVIPRIDSTGNECIKLGENLTQWIYQSWISWLK